MIKNKLTKTDFLQYLACQEELWLAVNSNETGGTPSLDALHMMEQGQLIDKLAKQFFKVEYASSFQARNIKILFQQEVETDGFSVRADITCLNEEKNSIILFEVKASTRVKEEHILDIAFQKMVFEQAGFVVDKCYSIYVDKSYVRNGEINLSDLLIVEEVSNEVDEAFAFVKEKAEEALVYINGPEPTKRILLECGNKLHCPFVQRHFSDLPEYSIFDISRIHKKKIESLVAANILDIMDVPADFDLSAKQRQQVDIAQWNEVIVNKSATAKELEELMYPLYFLDYETFAYVLPSQDGYAPYQQMLFQYSLHVKESPGTEVKHFEYLLEEKEEPVCNLLLSMKENIALQEGTVIVWNKSFEKTRNKECAERYPEFADFLLSLNERIYDLMDVFKKGYYLHPDFKGKTSLKSVLPVLCPELSYQVLLVQNGTEANIKWHHWTDGQFRGDENAIMKQALLDYCKLDTWAMVRIWEELTGIVTPKGININQQLKI